MAEGVGDILSMALQQTGVEQQQSNTAFPDDLGSLLTHDFFSSYSSQPIKQEPPTPVANGSQYDPLSMACATYLEPVSAQNQQLPQANYTTMKQEPMEYQQLPSNDSFNLEDINLDELEMPEMSYEEPKNDYIQPQNTAVYSNTVTSTLPEFHDDDLSRLLNEVAEQEYMDYPNTMSFSSQQPHREYQFPPRQVSPYGMSNGGNPALLGTGQVPRAQLMRPAGSVNAPFNIGPRKSLGMTRLQMNRFKLPAKSKTPELPLGPPGEEDSDEEDDSFTAADTYTNYTPTKLKLGYVHPDPVVESSSLSSVEPPQVWFDLKLPSHVIEERKLSSLQLESIVYACQQHMNILSDGTRAGFLVGDGAGVGKGRTIAGIIFQNYLEGRKKAVWLSVSNDLKYDAMRDLCDVGAKKIAVYSLNKFHYGKISGKRNGRVKKGVIFATYASLIGESSSGGKYKTRFNQLVHWLGTHFEGIIVFDECHKAKNLVPSGAGKPSKTGLTVLELQNKLPKARIVYCSATGASEPKNMAYMSRLGIWGKGTQFPSFVNFIKAVEGRGVGAMEMVAMDMKLRGMYIARQLSFAGVKFSVSEVELSAAFIEAYNASVELWIQARRLFQEAADLMGFEKKKSKSMWGQFWGSHQRFFKYMCIAAKVPETIRHAKQCLAEGKCVVIGLQSTGEARTMEQLEQEDGELSGFISTIKGVLETLIRRHFPSPDIGDLDWGLYNDERTPPSSCRKRKRGGCGRKRGLLFQEDDPGSSDSDSGGDNGSDSAVESSSEGDSESGSSTSDSEGESGTEEPEDYNPFGGGIGEPWLKKKIKTKKKSKSGPPDKKKRKNFSIKPPPTSSRKGKTKTGFNSKSLKFEPVISPNDFAAKKPLTPPVVPSPMESKPRVKPPVSLGEHSNIVDAMSARISTEAEPGEPWLGRDTRVRKMKEDLLKKVEMLSPHLPTNTLDELIDGLGGPKAVAEMTGRRGRVVSLPDGSVQYQLRSQGDVSIEMLNIAEKQRFMDGQKNIAIISEAASSGISLQADRRAKNQKLRVHITLELPWSADRAIQQFGRTHRSNQISAPEYIFLISQLSGEQRFASIVAKRLESLGALTHGDRRATESRDLSKFNVDTKYGRQALETTIKSIVGIGPKIISNKEKEEYNEEFFDQCRTGLIGVGILNDPTSVDKDSMIMSRFLNRILGLSVALQNKLFAYFSDTLAATIKRAKRVGKFDLGIMDFGASGEFVEIVDTMQFIGDPAFCTATTQLHKVKVERGMSFSEALDKLSADQFPGEGFYLSKRVRNDKQIALLLKSATSTGKLFVVYRPNTGRGTRTEKMSAILDKYSKASNQEEAERCWKDQYDASTDTCHHAYWQGRCKLALADNPCEVGLRRRTYHVLSGSILGVWTHVEGVFNRNSMHGQRMQIVRVRTENKRLVGILVPNSFVEDMKQTLQRVAQQALAEGTADNPIEL